jgi:hypothetical protein
MFIKLNYGNSLYVWGYLFIYLFNGPNGNGIKGWVHQTYFYDLIDFTHPSKKIKKKKKNPEMDMFIYNL